LRAALGDELGAMFADLHREHGSTCGWHPVQQLTGSHHVTAVLTDRGDELPADLAIVGVGARPNVDPPRGPGQRVADGITATGTAQLRPGRIRSRRHRRRLPSAARPAPEGRTLG
jgi:NADPH-dependent 2,4-dienoyl-CoA reductase/sulfur reductase-like enzyme